MAGFLQIDERDNVAVALVPLFAEEPIRVGAATPVSLVEDVPQKHKFALENLAVGDPVRMYGAVVGRVCVDIPRGGLLTTWNVEHDAVPYALGDGVLRGRNWT